MVLKKKSAVEFPGRPPLFATAAKSVVGGWHRVTLADSDNIAPSGAGVSTPAITGGACSAC
eukprot:7189286-Pyramimonas_sp.AAC.1